MTTSARLISAEAAALVRGQRSERSIAAFVERAVNRHANDSSVMQANPSRPTHRKRMIQLAVPALRGGGPTLRSEYADARDPYVSKAR